jgi:hypothetical protein
VERAWPSDLPPHMSFSQIRKFQENPDAYRRRYMLGEKGPPQGYFLVGDSFHAAVTWGFRQWLDHQLWPASSQVEEECVNAFGLGVTDDTQWGGSTAQIGLGQATDLCRAYWLSEAKNVKPVVLNKEFMIDVGAPVPIHGYLDCVTDSRIIDWKTAGRKSARASLEWRMQANIYQLDTFLPCEFQVITKTNPPAVYTEKEHPGLCVWPEGRDHIIRYVNTVCRTIISLYETFGPDEPWVGWWPERQAA